MFRRSRDFFTDILRQTDLVLLALCAAASLFGILMVASATRYMHTWRLVAVQSAALLLGVILYLLVSQVDLNDLSKYWKWIFLTGIIFILLLVTPLGIEDNTGNRAWLDFPFRKGAARRDREAHLHTGAGQAAGVAQGEPRPQQYPIHPVSGRPLRRDLPALL